MKTLILLFSIFIMNSVQAASDGLFSLQPVYGVENVTKIAPAPARVTTRTLYGARAVIGRSWLKGELEYTQGTDDEEIPSTSTSVSEDTKRYRAGIRMSAGVDILSAYLRAGYQRTEIERTITQSGSTSTPDVPTTESPYAGAGITMRIAQLLSINIGANLSRGPYVGDERKYNVEYQAGLRFSFGSVR